MANEQFAFLMKSKVPDVSTWQAAIDQCGFDFQIDPELVPFKHSGFLPCTLQQQDAGVEVDYYGSQDLLEEFSDLKDIVGDNDCCISFRWGGSMIEYASAMILSYALAKYFRAVVSYEGYEPMTDLDDFLIQTKEAIDEALGL